MALDSLARDLFRTAWLAGLAAEPAPPRLAPQAAIRLQSPALPRIGASDSPQAQRIIKAPVKGAGAEGRPRFGQRQDPTRRHEPARTAGAVYESGET